MKTTPFILVALAFSLSPKAEAANRALPCKKSVGNLCYRIDGTARSRIDSSAPFQNALNAVAKKMEGKSVVYIVQGYRTPAEQQRLVNMHCGGRSSCAGYASARTSRHVVSVAADPMLYSNQVKSVCYAENQARVEFLGPRSAAAVYGYDHKTNLTWAHIDDSTGSNYTPRNCGRNEGLNGNERLAQDSGAPTSKRVEDFKKKKVEEARTPASVAEGGSCGYYAILSCSHTLEGANGQRAELGTGLQVLRTDDVPNFAKGWYCVTPGSTTQDAAASAVRTFQSKAPTAYVKKGC